MSTAELEPIREVPTTPMTLLQTAIDQDIDVEKVRALMELQKDWQKCRAEEAFNQAMHDAQCAMPQVARDAKNNQTGSWFATLENVQKKARPVYGEHGFALCYGEEDCPTVGYKRTVCDVSHRAGHTRRYHLDLPIDGIGPKGNPIAGMNAVQGCISTTSYAQRRLLCMIFNITIADEDNDGQTNYAPVTQEQRAILDEWLVTTNTPAARFLKAYNADSLDEFPAHRFEEAIAAFKRKQAQQR